MVLLLKTNQVQVTRLKIAINNVFSKRNAHNWPNQLPPPLSTWVDRYKNLAQDFQIPQTSIEAFQALEQFLKENQLL